MSNFEPNAIIRGAQLTLVGGSCSPRHFLKFSQRLTRNRGV